MLSLSIWLVSWQPTETLAGCHYLSAPTSNGSDPSGHVRDFRFLGQWVYERGDIKYVAWQNDQPCDGPNCSATPDDSAHPIFSPPTKPPGPTVLMACWRAFYLAAPTTGDSFDLLNLDALSGHPHPFEYPP